MHLCGVYLWLRHIQVQLYEFFQLTDMFIGETPSRETLSCFWTYGIQVITIPLFHCEGKVQAFVLQIWQGECNFECSL